MYLFRHWIDRVMELTNKNVYGAYRTENDGEAALRLPPHSHKGVRAEWKDNLCVLRD